MLTFDKSFFLGETRDDFYIEPMMKSVWAVQMDVLQVIHEICERHHIRWFACSGTLLGAARHKGFIPWDDDMDICMLRSDYNRFIQVAPPELPAGFQLLSPYTNDKWSEPFALVKNTERVNYSPEHLAAFHGCPYTVGVDIFPYDALPDDPSEESVVGMLFSALFLASRQTDTDLEAVMESLPELEEMCGIKFDTSHNLKNQLLRAADKVCQLYDISECDYVAHYASHVCRKTPFRKEWFAETIQLPFENMTVSAPKEYDAILRTIYGDWRIPVRNTATHDYPFYKKQEEAYRNALAQKKGS